MIKFAQLADKMIEIAPNAVLNHVVTKQGIREVTLLQPTLLTGIKKPGDFLDQLSASIRTLLSWFRDYKRHDDIRSTILKQSQPGEEVILDGIVNKLVLKNEVLWV